MANILDFDFSPIFTDDITQCIGDGFWTGRSDAAQVTLQTDSLLGGERVFQIVGTNQHLWRDIPASTGVTIGFYARLVSTSGGAELIQWRNASGSLLNLYVHTDGKMYVRRGSTDLGGPSGTGLSSTVFKFIEISVTFSDTVGTVELRVDGVAQAGVGGSGLDTANVTLGTGCTEVRFNWTGGGGTEVRFSRVYFKAKSASPEFLGPQKHVWVPFDSDETPNQWTRNTGATDFGAVDENPPNEDTDYLEESTVGQQTRHGTALALPATAVVRGYTVTTVSKLDSGTVGLDLSLESNGVVGNSGKKAVISGSYGGQGHCYRADPDGAAAWTYTKANAARPQIELVT